MTVARLPCAAQVFAAALFALVAMAPASAEENLVAPAPTPPPAAGPTKDAAQGFCGDTIVGHCILLLEKLGAHKTRL